MYVLPACRENASSMHAEPRRIGAQMQGIVHGGAGKERSKERLLRQGSTAWILSAGHDHHSTKRLTQLSQQRIHVCKRIRLLMLGIHHMFPRRALD